jgi:tRNA modification GTPase
VNRVACLTPPGTAALAVLAVHGPDAWDLIRPLFRPLSSAGLPAEPDVGRFWLGRLGDELADEVVLAVKYGRPLPLLELHCHGGREVVRLLLELLTARGCSLCTWQELESALDSDPLRAAAATALVQARTTRTAAVLLDQYHGALARTLDAILEARRRQDGDAAGRLLDELAGRSALGRHLAAPWRVTVAGAPNVGKSSLVNALAGFQRSVVSASPGTTRDVVTTVIAVDGWPVELADTAGMRDTAGALEEQGIRLAEQTAAAADLCLWVLDASAPPAWPPSASDRLRLVVNKLDLPAAWDLGQAPAALRVSAQTGAGLAELVQALAGWLVPQPPPPGAAVPFTPLLCDRVAEARAHCAAGKLPEAVQTLEAARQAR